MAESKDNLRSRVVAAINEGNREDLRRLIAVAKSLKAKDELEMLKEAISSHNAFTHILYKGKSFPTIKSLAKAISIPPEILRQRMKNNLPQEKWADPVKQHSISYLGEKYHSLAELADRLNISRPTLYKRIRDRWPQDRWGESTLKNNRESRIVERYQQGDNIKKLAISFGLKMKVIEDLLDRNGVLQAGDKQEPESKKQLNIRLDNNYQKKISDIRNYWNKKGVFQFAEKQLSDLTVLNSEASLSKFILETALDNLYLELQTELKIDQHIEDICKIRGKDKNLHPLWEQVKSKHYEFGSFKNFVSDELDLYQKKIEQIGLKKIGINSRKDNIDENVILEEKFWKIAIKKSYLIPDKNDEDTSEISLQKKLMEILKNKYPDI